MLGNVGFAYDAGTPTKVPLPAPDTGGTFSTLGLTRVPEDGLLLYFAYTARIAPDRMAEVSPDASFEFIAHLPEWGLEFPIDGNGWGGSLPSATPNPGSTVWGAVYSVPEGDLGAIDRIETSEGRESASIEAMDRMGRRHHVVTHLAEASVTADSNPSPEYVGIMLAGSRHWSLPAGWIAGLEEHLDDAF
jgi:AIG2-like family